MCRHRLSAHACNHDIGIASVKPGQSFCGFQSRDLLVPYFRPTFINTMFAVDCLHQLFATTYVFIMYFIFQNIGKYSQIIK